MSNPIKKLLQLPWKPFKKRFDRFDRNLAAGRLQAILMQAENNGLLLGSLRRENRDAHKNIEAIVERLSQNTADLNQALLDMSGRVADLAAKFETLNALDRVLASNDARTEELENKVDELLERLDALEAAVARSNAGTKPSKD